MEEVLDCTREVPTRLPEIESSCGSTAPSHCYYDGFPFGSQPPVEFHGLAFCSLACSLAHATPDQRVAVLAQHSPYLTISPAPPKFLLRPYGGSMGLSQFRNETVEEPVGLHCFYDAHPFDGPPAVTYQGMPFCAASCLLAYIRDNAHVGSTTEYRVRVTHELLAPAPPVRLLTIFGGPLSIEAFRAFSGFMYLHPMRTLSPGGMCTTSEGAAYSQLPVGWSPWMLQETDVFDAPNSLPAKPPTPVLKQKPAVSRPLARVAPRATPAPVPQRGTVRLPFTLGAHPR